LAIAAPIDDRPAHQVQLYIFQWLVAMKSRLSIGSGFFLDAQISTDVTYLGEL
jgi:hypothetical protein